MCAAPNSAYRAEKLHDGTTNANSVKADIAIPNATESTLKARFYLDFMLNTTKDGVAGFVGGCTIGSDNYAMHNTARHWTGRGRGPSGQMIQWFNDAGLNTLARATGFNLISDRVNDVRFSYYFSAAWYVNSTHVGVRLQINSGDPLVQNIAKTIVQQTSETQEFTGNYIGLKAGDTIHIKPTHTNGEGLWTPASYTHSILVKPAMYSAKYHATYASSAYLFGTAITLYANEANLGIDTQFYTNEAMTTIPGQGYVTIGEMWYEIRPTIINDVTVMRVVDYGDCTPTGWPVGDPNKDTGGYDTIQAHRSASDYLIPCQNFQDGLLPNATIYRRHFDNRYYTNTSWDTYANGYYVWGTANWKHITNGNIVADGICPAGT